MTRLKPILRTLLVAGLDGLLAGCVAREPPRWVLVEKGPYQVLARPDGETDRLLLDRDGDRRADVVVLYGPRGTMAASEIDTDLDGVVDRWESFDDGGRLRRVGRARRVPGTPDEWDSVGADGLTGQRESDDDGDGRVDHLAYTSGGAVFLEEIDTDHDGAVDRRVFLDPQGRVLRVQADRDHDGAWETVRPR